MQEFISGSVSVENKKHFVFASFIIVSDKKRCDSWVVSLIPYVKTAEGSSADSEWTKPWFIWSYS